METATGDEAALGAPQVTHIDVHIHQEPVPGLSFLRQPSVPNTPTPSQTLGSRRLLVASWAVLAGVTVFIYEKRGGMCWALLKTLLALAAFGTAIAAIYIGADSFYGNANYWFLEWCGIPQPWEPTRHPSTPEEARRQRLCLSYKDMFETLCVGLKTILLSVWVLLLLTSLVPLLLLCCRKLQPKVEKDRKALLGASEM